MNGATAAAAAATARTVYPRSCRVQDFSDGITDSIKYVEIPLAQEATILSRQPTQSALSEDTLLVGTYGDKAPQDRARILMKFDVYPFLSAITTTSAIPTVLCAEVGLALVEEVSRPAIEMFSITSPWGGRQQSSPSSTGVGSSSSFLLGATRDALEGEATWSFASSPTTRDGTDGTDGTDGIMWQRTGGDIDFSTALSRERRESDQSIHWYGGRINDGTLVGLVQGWMEYPNKNNGLALVQRQEGTFEYVLYKSGKSNDLPYLMMVYEVATENEGPVASPVRTTPAPVSMPSQNNPSQPPAPAPASAPPRVIDSGEDKLPDNVVIGLGVLIPVMILIAIVVPYVVRRWSDGTNKAHTGTSEGYPNGTGDVEEDGPNLAEAGPWIPRDALDLELGTPPIQQAQYA